MLVAFIFTYYILLLPLIILVLYIGCKRWRRQRSVARSATTSHSDIFTFHMVVVELIGFLSLGLLCVNVLTNEQSFLSVGTYSLAVLTTGQTLFHLLTCVDRYLAVVHPITYMRLRQRGGVRIRNISIVCVWLLCFGLIGPSALWNFFFILNVLLVSSSSIVISFSCLSILCVLNRPGPGEGGRNMERVDKSKLRAFHTVTAIMGTLLLKFLVLLITYVLLVSSVLSDSGKCLLGAIENWLSLPSSLVLPLLFLHRAGKLPGCKHNTESS